MKTVNDNSFKRFGKVLDYNCSDIIGYLEKSTTIPKTNNIYIAKDKNMEQLKSFNIIKDEIYNQMPMQMGYCNGNNSLLNCLEWHNSIEVEVMADDLVLLLARVEDLNDEFKIDSEAIESYKALKGTVLMLYPQTLHFSPCKLNDNGFKCAIILEEGVNTPLEKQSNSALLFKKDKCLIAHKDSKQAKENAYIGIIGDNIKINY